MSARILTVGEVKMNTNFDDKELNFYYEIRQEAAKLINLIHKSTPRSDMSPEQNGEWNRLRALASTNIQQGILWAIEAEDI